jgi:hypothetical protein
MLSFLSCDILFAPGLHLGNLWEFFVVVRLGVILFLFSTIDLCVTSLLFAYSYYMCYTPYQILHSNLSKNLIWTSQVDMNGKKLLRRSLICWYNFQPFDFERIWWRLFQKRVVRTKFDIYVLLTIMHTHIGDKNQHIFWTKCNRMQSIQITITGWSHW